jgi:hypothetical protein
MLRGLRFLMGIPKGMYSEKEDNFNINRRILATKTRGKKKQKSPDKYARASYLSLKFY